MSQLVEFEAVLRLAQAGDYSAAISLCRRIVTGDAEHAPAWHLLGACLLKLGKPAEAATSLCKAVELKPCTAVYRSNLGAAELQLGNVPEAVRYFRDAVELHPDETAYKLHLAAGLCRAGDLDEALAILEQVPTSIDVMLRRGEVQLALDRTGDAKLTYQEVLNGNPRLAVAWHGLGKAHLTNNAYSAAVECLRNERRFKGVASASSFALANALERSGEHEEAAAALAELSQVQPGNFALKVRQAMLLPAVFDEQSQIEAAHAAAIDELTRCFEYSDKLNLETVLQSGCCPPFHLTHLGTDNRRFRETVANGFASQIPSIPINPLGQARPRVGMVVTRGHEGIFLRGMAGFFRERDRDRIEIRVFCDARRRELITAKADLHADEAVSLRGSIPEMTRVITEARCDTLHYWEIGTDTTNFFLAQHRLAPHQCTSIGVQETSGIATIDDYISSDWLDSPDDQRYFTERLIRFQTIPHFVERPTALLDPEIKIRLGLPNDRTIYLCNQNPLKIHPAIDTALGSILRGDPRGIVVLTAGLAKGIQTRISARFTRSIPDVVDRVIWTDWLNDDQFKSLTAAADVILDSFPMAGSSTSYTTLGLGTPIVTLCGNLSRGRMTSGCYRLMGIEELTSTSVSEYVAMAIAVATDSSYRNHLCQLIRERSAILFDNLAAVDELQGYFQTTVI